MNPRKYFKHSTSRLLLAVALVSLAIPAVAQQADITLNWKDADIRKVVEAVSEVTGKNFIIDPRVTGKVTLLSATPMSPDAFYEAFLSILQVHGYVAIPSGDLIKILPDATARQFAGPDRYWVVSREPTIWRPRLSRFKTLALRSSYLFCAR